MKNTTRLFSALLSLSLFSCYAPRYMYSPSASNVPVLVKQGDSKVAAYYSTDLSAPFSTNNSGKDKSNGLELQGAVAITNGFAIQANYMTRSERNGSNDNNSDKTVINYKRSLAEFGIGYFKAIGRGDKVLFQVFGGAGKGEFSFIDNGQDANGIFGIHHHQADVFKVYFQPAFIFRPKETFALSVSSRFSIINFRNIKTDYTDADLGNYLLSDLPHGSRTFWEPAFTNTIGFAKAPGFKLEYQVLFSVQVDDRNIDYRSVNFALGIVLDIPKLFKPVSPAGKN
ncbi:MAG: hypothetical protein ABIN67_15275 [Ferruginibacter sp.]